MAPPIEVALSYTDNSKFTLVTLAAKRARQLNSYFNQLHEGLGALIPPLVDEPVRTPLSIALTEIASGKIRMVESEPSWLFDLALDIADGSPVKIFMRTSDEAVLGAVTQALGSIAGVTGRSVQLDHFERGSLFGKWGPYGDGKPLADREKKEIDNSHIVRPMQGHETAAAVDFSVAARDLHEALMRAEEYVVLTRTYIRVGYLSNGNLVEIGRDLTPAETRAVDADTLRLDLKDMTAVLYFITGSEPPEPLRSANG